MGPEPKDSIKLFLGKVDKCRQIIRHEIGYCWIWTGAISKSGYGVFTSGSRAKGERKTYRSHRFSYEHFVGFIPEDILVLHKCDNPPCVNPDHLFLGTQKENIKDCIDKKRRVFAPNASLTAAQVEHIRKAYNQKTNPSRRLAKEYGVDKTTILDIINFKRWK